MKYSPWILTRMAQTLPLVFFFFIATPAKAGLCRFIVRTAGEAIVLNKKPLVVIPTHLASAWTYPLIEPVFLVLDTRQVFKSKGQRLQTAAKIPIKLATRFLGYGVIGFFIHNELEDLLLGEEEVEFDDDWEKLSAQIQKDQGPRILVNNFSEGTDLRQETRRIFNEMLRGEEQNLHLIEADSLEGLLKKLIRHEKTYGQVSQINFFIDEDTELVSLDGELFHSQEILDNFNNLEEKLYSK